LTAKQRCICGQNGHPINSMACPIHGEQPATNAKAYALGEQRRSGFHIRRIVWGRLMARAERRPGEKIRRARLYVKPE